jgi:hypothetical protein
VANLLFIYTKATDRSAAGFVPACTAGDPATLLVGENSIVRHRGVSAAGETSALVARCVL